jgi:membrane-associated protease RseP (regulator of RpoE activity)
LIRGVLDGQPAAIAGLQPGDVVTHIDGKPASSGTQLRNFVASVKPGTTVQMTVSRDGKKLECPSICRNEPMMRSRCSMAAKATTELLAVIPGVPKRIQQSVLFGRSGFGENKCRRLVGDALHRTLTWATTSPFLDASDRPLSDER